MHFTIHGVLILLLVLLALGVVLWLVVVMLMAWMLLHPPRMSAGRAIYHLRRLSPGDLGLAFEEQSFTVRDSRSGKKLFIAGWWIPASVPSGRCVVLLHGYADAKVGGIAWAPLLHELNLNILAVDLRAHGNSDGKYSTGGFFEREDISQCIDELLGIFPNQTRQLMLFGASLGSAVACGVAAARDDISGIILESPFTNYKKVVTAHVRSLGLPDGITVRAALATAQWISGADFDQVRPVDLMKKIKCPMLAIVGSDDELLDEEDFQLLRLATTANPASTFWLVERAGHLQAMATDPAGYKAHALEFVNRIDAQKVNPREARG